MSANEKIPEEKSVSTPNRLIAFRPLFWWVPISLLLLAYDFHRINAPRTIIRASVTLDGRRLAPGEQVSVSVDGERVSLGNPVPIGKRRLKVEMKDATPYEADVDVWYGTNTIGTIDLKRQQGVLDLEITPGADLIELKGPYRELSVANVSALRTNIPVGNYQMNLSFGRLVRKGSVSVKANETVTKDMAPNIGVLDLRSNRDGANFQLTRTNLLAWRERGSFPARVPLEVGNYSLEAWRDDYRKIEQVEITKGATNRLDVSFDYGTLDLKTDPTDVRVIRNRREVGVTPIKLELKPGKHDLRLNKSGFQSLDLPVEISENQTVVISTNLVNLGLRQALRQAELLAGDKEFERAIESIESALSIDPGNAQALRLQKEYARELSAIQQEQALAGRRAAIEAEFDQQTTSIEQAELFDRHSWTWTAPYEVVRAAVRNSIPKANGRYTIESEQALTGTSSLFRGRSKGLKGNGSHCVVLVGEVSQSECQVVAKFWDFIAPTKSGISIGAFLNLEKYIPVHPKFFGADQRQSVLDRRRAIGEEFRGLVEAEIRGRGGN